MLERRFARGKEMKTCCECHYLCFDGSDPCGKFIESLSKKYRCREEIEKIISVEPSPVRIKCYQGIWDSKDLHKTEKTLFQIFGTNRSKCIFYTKNIENIDLEAMEKKTQIEINNKDKKITRVIAIFALAISIISLIKSFFL